MTTGGIQESTGFTGLSTRDALLAGAVFQVRKLDFQAGLKTAAPPFLEKKRASFERKQKVTQLAIICKKACWQVNK